MILVTGATGFIGRHVVHQLIQDGLPVRCLIQTDRLKAITWDMYAPNAPQIVEGSLLNEEAVFQAVTGVHTIIHLENALWWGRQRDLERVEISGTQKLIAAARSARVGRLIFLSQLGSTPASAYVLHKIKGQVEEQVRSSGLAYTILRVGLVFGEDDAFINHLAMMLKINPVFFLMPGGGEVVLHPLYIADLVRAIMGCLESLDAVDRTIEIGGIEYTTLNDLIRTVMRVCRIRRVVIPIPPYLLRNIVRFYSLIMPRTLMTTQWLDILATNRATQLSNMYENFGFQPRRLEDTLLTYLPQQPHFRRGIRYVLRRRPRAL
jgi:NADH dehydrogenase